MPEHVWTLLGIDPVEARIIVVGFQMGTEAEARAVLQERLADEGNEDVIYSGVFDILRPYPKTL